MRKAKKLEAPKALNFVVKNDFNVGGYHEDQRKDKKKKVKHKKDYRFDQ